MPYSHKRTGKNEVTVYKKDSGAVVGHTTPEKLNDYMAALHMHEPQGMSEGGEVGTGLLKQVYDDEDEDSSPGWERIKGWVGAHDKAKKHPIQQMAERENRKVQGYEEGGEVGNPLSDPLMQPPGAGIIAPSAVAAPPMAPAPVQVAPKPAPPAVSAATQPPPPAAAPVGMSYESEAAKALGTSPEELKAFLTKTMTPTGGEMLGRAGAAFGEGLSAAGGAPRDYTAQYDKLIQQQKENQAGIPGKVTELGKERFTLAHELQTQDPNSPYSKIEQNANRNFLKQLGATDADVSRLPADAIKDIRDGKIELKKALAEIEATGVYRAGMLGLQAEAEKTRQAEAATRAREAEKGALEDVTKGSKLPFFGPSHAQKQEAYKKLENLGGMGQTYAPDVLSYSQRHGITPEQAQAIKDRRTGGQ